MREVRRALLLAASTVLVVGCSSGGSDKAASDTTLARTTAAAAATTAALQVGAECPDGSAVGRDSVIETHCGGTAGVQLTVGSQVAQLRGGDCTVDDAGIHLKAGALTDPKVPAAPKKDYVDLEVPAGGVNPTLVATTGGSSPTWEQVTVQVEPNNTGGTVTAHSEDGKLTLSASFTC